MYDYKKLDKFVEAAFKAFHRFKEIDPTVELAFEIVYDDRGALQAARYTFRWGSMDQGDIDDIENVLKEFGLIIWGWNVYPRSKDEFLVEFDAVFADDPVRLRQTGFITNEDVLDPQ